MNTRILLVIVSVFVWSGCRARAPRSEPNPALPAPRPSAPPSAPATPVSVPPPAPTSHRVALILGPGGAKAFAHVGVLRALQKQRIPIDKIVGLEWGALVGGLFAHRGQVHDVEWKLYKMEQQSLPRPPKGMFGRGGGPSDVSVMNQFLKDSFGDDDAANARVAFACPTRSLWTGVVTWQTRGPFRDVVKRCLPYPPTFTVEGNAIAGASPADEAVELLRKEGYDVIVLVNVLGTAQPTKQDGAPEDVAHVILWQEVRRTLLRTATAADVESVIVDTAKYPILQYDANKELVQLGDAAGAAAATRLIRKYGF